MIDQINIAISVEVAEHAAIRLDDCAHRREVADVINIGHAIVVDVIVALVDWVGLHESH